MIRIATMLQNQINISAVSIASKNKAKIALMMKVNIANIMLILKKRKIMTSKKIVVILSRIRLSQRISTINIR